MTADVGHSNPGTVVDLEIAGSALVVSWTDLFPPGTYTLSGVVTKRRRGDWCRSRMQKCGAWTKNNRDGTQYDRQERVLQLHGLSDGSRQASFSKEGYETIDRVTFGPWRHAIRRQLLRRWPH